MVDRKEIQEKIKLEVWERAGGKAGTLTCEGCGLRLGGKAFQYDHQIEEWEQTLPRHQRPPIVAADVKLLGQDCCHEPKTTKKAGERAHGKRLVKKAAKVTKPRGRPMLGSKASGWKKPMDGKAVRRDK